MHNSGALRLRFWTEFERYMQSKSTIRCAKPSVDGWMDHGADLNGGVLYSIMRTRLGEIGVQFALNDSTAATIYSWLQSRSDELRAAFDEELNWHDPEGAQTSLIETRRTVDLSDESQWPEYFDWMRARLEAFQAVLGPIVGRVPPPQDAGHSWDEESFFSALEVAKSDGCRGRPRVAGAGGCRRVPSHMGTRAPLRVRDAARRVQRPTLRTHQHLDEQRGRPALRRPAQVPAVGQEGLPSGAP